MATTMNLDQLNDWLEEQCPLAQHIETYYPNVELKQKSNGKWEANACHLGGHKTTGKEGRLNINEQGVFNCYGCDDVVGRGAVKWEMLDKGIDFNTAIRQLAEQYGFQVPYSKPYTPEQIAENDKKAIGQRILNAAAQYYHNQLTDEARDYYNNRGLGDEIIDEYQLGWAGKKIDGLTKSLLGHFEAADILATGLVRVSKRTGKLVDQWHNGYILPYHINRNNVSYFAWRNGTPGAEPKYMKLSTDAESDAVVHTVLGIYKLTSIVDKPILIVEGVIDYYLAQQEVGDEYIVISPGTIKFSDPGQLQLLINRLVPRKISTSIVICNDADDSGQAGALKTAKSIETTMADIIAETDDKKDSQARKAKAKAKRGPGRPSNKSKIDPRMPQLFIARLQKTVDGGCVDLADYIKDGRLEDLKYRISPFNAPSVRAIELYEKGDPNFAFEEHKSSGSFKPAIFNYLYTSEGRYFQNKDEKLRRNNGRVYVDDKGYTKTQVSNVLAHQANSYRNGQVVSLLLEKYNSMQHGIENPENLIPFLNGWLDIHEALKGNFSLMKPSPHIFMTREIQAKFFLKPSCPKFHEFLEQIAPGCEDLIYEMIGYCFHNSTDMQKGFFLFGPSGTGKSTLIKVMEGLFGIGNYSSHSLHYMEENSFASAKLKDKFANMCADIPHKPIKELERFKKSITGDSQEVEFKGIDSMTVIPTCKHIYSMNDLPPIFTSTGGLLRRLCMPIFPNVFSEGENEERQTQFVAKLLTEADHIASMSLLSYLIALDKQEFTLPDVSKEKLAEYDKEMKPENGFIDSCFFKGHEDDFVTRRQVWTHYKEWCEVYGFGEIRAQHLYKAISDRLRIKSKSTKYIKDPGTGRTKQYEGFKGVGFTEMEEVQDEIARKRTREAY